MYVKFPPALCSCLPYEGVSLLSQNDSDRFKDIPIDRRHLEAKAAKAKKGKLKRDMAGGAGRYVSPPSIKDFPKSWLPRPSGRPQISASAVPLHRESFE